MPMNTLDSLAVNLHKYPSTIQNPNANDTLTIGDLHGNVLLFLHFLISYNVLETDEKTYQELVLIFKLADENRLLNVNFHRFRALINWCTVPENLTTKLIALGDMLADRRGNDLLMLYVLFFLIEKGVSIEIIFSNHDFELIRFYELGYFNTIEQLADVTRTAYRINYLNTPHSTAQSLFHCVSFLSKCFHDDMPLTLCNNLIKDTYLPKLKMLSYRLSDCQQEITLFVHAPIEFRAIAVLAQRFGVLYEDETPKALAQVIDGINRCFQEHVQKNTLSKDLLPHFPDSIKKPKSNPQLCVDEIIAYFIWNRISYAPDYQWEPNKTYKIIVVHGHDLPDLDIFCGAQAHENGGRINLDNWLGKRSDFDHTMTENERVNSLSLLKIVRTNPLPLSSALNNNNNDDASKQRLFFFNPKPQKPTVDLGALEKKAMNPQEN